MEKRNNSFGVDPIYNKAMPWWKYEIYGPELMGMRLLRKKSIREMIKVTEDQFDIIGIEKDESYIFPAPPPMAGIYMRHLNCTMHHVYQFRDILTGNKKDFNDSRKINKQLKEQVKKKCGNRCVVCKSKDNLHMHHIKEYAKGGRTDLENLILLCASCHAETHRDNKSYYALKKIASEGLK
ncbi:HNH endonuclease [Bacillus sp. WMMC1349]|uniref:HNH endonuclease n=1 Tax=Bacillus sp. WMMC1349 TaxID=2736254 RepID=UPI0015558B25|nr:HNH endonuclease signature motif containing protein [Bacillus sp. WMMC1349]NPC91210.1 HNH endonuclease [Bacillus sp. WMMC1349]